MGEVILPFYEPIIATQPEPGIPDRREGRGVIDSLVTSFVRFNTNLCFNL